MTKAHSVIIVGAATFEEELIRSQLDGVAEILASEPDPKTAEPMLRETAHSVTLLYLDHDPDGVLALSRDVLRRNGSAPIVVSRDRDPDRILMAMRSGVRDFAYLEEGEDDVRRAIANLATTAAHDGDSKPGQVIATFACKGGSGATMLATNLAGALLADGASPRVVLVDLNFQMGDVLVFLDLASSYGFTDLLANVHRLDEELLHKSLTTHSCGIRVLAQSDQLEDADELDGRSVSRVIAFLRQHYDYVVLDGLRDFNEAALAALDSADQIALTMTQDIPALKNAKRCLSLFNRLGYDRDKVKTVLNRYHRRGKLDLDSIADALGTSVDRTIANDFPTVIGAINQGELLTKAAPRARVTRDIHELLPVLGAGVDNRPRRGLLGRLAR